ncbi:DUF4385 family protein [Bacillus sp. JCM 19041]
MYCTYKEDDDCVGMNMTHKFLQMDYTRLKRYATYPG